jgi:hypothetical protein
VTQNEVHQLLTQIRPTTPEGADWLLDLRELLISRGHPGKCVRCFFELLGDLDQPGALRPLRHWLEQHLVVEVTAAGQALDTLPVRLNAEDDLESFCHRTIHTVRFDRSFRHQHIALRFRFKDQAAA